jgi:hypothetical protein
MRPSRWIASAAAGVLPLVTAMAGCSDEQGRSVAGYCAEVTANLAAISNPAIETAGDIAATLDRYRAVGASAPADVEPEWQVMIDSLETAATLVPGDAEQLAAVNEAALSSQSAATRIQQYTKANCAADIGTPPAPTNPVTVTTVPPTSTT